MGIKAEGRLKLRAYFHVRLSGYQIFTTRINGGVNKFMIISSG